jgi:hypothetical protein
MLGAGEQVHQGGQSFAVRIWPQIFVIDHEQIEGMEHVADTFTVQDEITRQLVNILEHGLRQPDEQSLFVDAMNCRVLFPNQHPPAIEFLLHHIGRIN